MANSRLARGGAAVATAVLLAVLAGCETNSAPYQVADPAVVEEIRGTFGSDSGSTGGTAEPTEQPTGFASLTGRITLAGTPPENPLVEINRDQAVCDPGGGEVRERRVLVGAGGGLANVLIFLDTSIPDDPLWLHDSARLDDSEMVEFDQRECIFLSRVFAFQTGQTVRILNSDPVGHNTKMDPSSNPPYNEIISANGYKDVTSFTRSERAPFLVSCTIHPWMKAYMICRENGYFAVTDDEGNFTIPNLPAGVDLEFKIWHEACEFRLSSLQVNGSEEALGRGGKWSMRLSEEEPERVVDVVIQADQL